MKSKYQPDNFTKQLLKWYGVNKRNLPWRDTNDPYKIWLSEIILQQTRVDQGMAYYHNFVEKYPTVSHLARDTTDNVLKLWQGLGYYSRARNLHQTAQVIDSQYNAAFPATYEGLLALKGIGPYTAAAIASIAFNQPVAVLDGNVYRLLSRYFGIYTPIDGPGAKKEFTQLANALVPPGHAADFNQAMMDMGAMVCTPRKPLCTDCVLHEKCFAQAKGLQEQFPVKSKKTKTRERRFAYFLVSDGQSFLLAQRTGKDIWQGLYELPLIEDAGNFDESLLAFVKQVGAAKTHALKHNVYSAKHMLTHQVIQADFYLLPVKRLVVPPGMIAVNKRTYAKYAVSRLTDKFMKTPFFIAHVINARQES